MASKQNTIAIIMAGGEGKRMQSTKPKVLHEVVGVPMLYLILKKVVSVGITSVYIVCGKHKDAIISCIQGHVSKDDMFNGVDLVYVDQPIPKGTGDAIKCCLPYLSYADKKYENVLILNGDTPLINKSLEGFFDYNVPSLMVMDLENPLGQGRIITDNVSGKFIKIVEEKDANDTEKSITTVNCGVYLVSRHDLLNCVPKLKNNNKQGEFYLTDICEMLQESLNLYKVHNDNREELLNVNTKKELEIANIAYIKKWFVQQNLELRTLTQNDYEKGYMRLLEQLSSSAQETDSECFNDIYNMVNANPNYKIYVVEDTNTKNVIANTTLLLERKFIHGGKYVAHIEDVVVDNKYRGKQIGQMLLRYVSCIASAEMNCYKSILDCKSSLVKFYESCGFSETSVQMSNYH